MYNIASGITHAIPRVVLGSSSMEYDYLLMLLQTILHAWLLLFVASTVFCVLNSPSNLLYAALVFAGIVPVLYTLGVGQWRFSDPLVQVAKK